MWKRSWFRWTVRCVALLLLAIFSITFYYRWHGENELAEARKEFTEKVGPLDPKAYEPKPVKDEDNGGRGSRPARARWWFSRRNGQRSARARGHPVLLSGPRNKLNLRCGSSSGMFQP